VKDENDQVVGAILVGIDGSQTAAAAVARAAHAADESAGHRGPSEKFAPSFEKGD